MAQRSVYLPIMKQGGDTNTIQVVNGIRDMIGRLFGIPKSLVATVVFDQSAFVKEAIRTLLHEGLIGLALTSLMILIFLASLRATVAVFLSIPLSALTTFVILYLLGSTVNTMILGGLALAFSRIIDNSVISLENIYRHLEEGSAPDRAAEDGRCRSQPGGAGRDAHHRGGFLPGHFLIRRQQISFHGSGAGRGHLAVRLVLRGDDRHTAVLRPLSQKRSQHRCGADGGSATPGKAVLGTRFNAAFNRAFTRPARFL